MEQEGRAMTFEFDVERYLGEEEMREIAEDELRKALRRRLDTQYSQDTLVANAANICVWDAVNEVMGEDARQAIARKVPEVIASLDKYSVFRKGDNRWSGEDSVGQKMLEAALQDSKWLLRDRVTEILLGLDPSELRSMVKEAVYDAVVKWMAGE